jgi:hypothetical protein
MHWRVTSFDFDSYDFTVHALQLPQKRKKIQLTTDRKSTLNNRLVQLLPVSDIRPPPQWSISRFPHLVSCTFERFKLHTDNIMITSTYVYQDIGFGLRTLMKIPNNFTIDREMDARTQIWVHLGLTLKRASSKPK